MLFVPQADEQFRMPTFPVRLHVVKLHHQTGDVAAAVSEFHRVKKQRKISSSLDISQRHLLAIFKLYVLFQKSRAVKCLLSKFVSSDSRTTSGLGASKNLNFDSSIHWIIIRILGPLWAQSSESVPPISPMYTLG
ncbi:hypothetical protein HNY73_013994 [Argiope bruennichi]|uniref:Uncharacterized protein n=1 Tax=Argiope bruennichi TaxID=94029 RepID=A0A8T0EST5_ARGBR|nr:hypothetical protein HNY73_013994 [Argiope bruennichi]